MGDEDKKQKKENNHKLMAVGLEMVDLIELVGEKFREKYGFKPSIIDITDLISRRVIDNKLF